VCIDGIERALRAEIVAKSRPHYPLDACDKRVPVQVWRLAIEQHRVHAVEPFHAAASPDR
jgi:hypothetical protein